jgi:cathepsin D
MGMAYESLSVQNSNPVFQTLVAEGQVDCAVFSFKFDTSGSELFLGGVNPAYKEEDFTWIPVTKEVR